VDGVSRMTSGGSPRSINNSSSFLIGRSGSSSFPNFIGQLDEIAVYPAALPAAKVIGHRNAGLGQPLPPPAPVYRTEVTTDAPRAYWRLGETSGATALNEIVGGANGTYQNGVVLNTFGALVGDTNRAVSLDGTNDQVNMGDPANGSLDFGTGDFTVEAWVRAWANNERVILSKRDTTGPYWQLTVSDDAGRVGHVRATFSDGSPARNVYGPGIRVDNGAWHHVVAVFDRDTGVTVWVDGLAASTAGALPGSISNAGSFVIGKTPTSDTFPYLMAVVDVVALYPRVLPSTRITAHRDAGAGLG
jgi:hypothetical protein